MGSEALETGGGQAEREGIRRLIGKGVLEVDSELSTGAGRGKSSKSSKEDE